ncbi:MAG TPA: iron ABC transporter permease [Candidatus Nanopelagicaceae bacterium]
MLFYWPLGKILSLGFTSHLLSTVATQRNASLVWFTVWQAALSAGLSLLFGIPGAYVLYHRSFPGQKFLRALITVPFILPTIVVAIGFTAFRQLPIISALLMGHSGIPVIICANIFMNYSLAVRIVGGVWTTLDGAIEDAAALDGAGRLRTLKSITLPQLSNSIASAGALIFLYCAANFGIVLVLGGASTRTIETEIYVATTQYLDLQRTSGLVLVQTVLTVIAFVVAQRFSKGHMGFGSTTSLEARSRIDLRDLPAIALTAIFVGGLIVVPISTVMIRAFQVDSNFTFLNFTNLAGHGARDLLAISVGQATLNTFRNAIITVALSISVGVVVSYLISRSALKRKSRSFQRAMDIVFQMPVGISSVVLGIGYLVCFSGGLFPLRSSWLVTPIAQSLLTIPLVIRLIYPSLMTIDEELLESAETESADPSQIWWLIEIPIIRDVVVIATGYAAIVSIGEFGAANFLAYGDQGTLPTVLYQLISRPGAQNYGMAMATSSLLIALALVVVYALSALDREKG